MKMRIRPAEVEIPERTPFEHDLLDRKKPAGILTELVNSIDGPCVLAVDAAWGAGKTTFFKMWAQDLRNNGFPVVSFNAWETDYADDPFLSLVSEIAEGLRECKETTFSQKIQDTKEAATKVLVRAIPGLVRIATAGVLDIQPLIEKETGQILSSLAETRITKYQEAQSSIAEFRAKLGLMAEAVVESNEQRSLIVMIDELDRCRPSYAIELLEVAKHLFEVDHIVFALAVNRTQLAHSIRALYGSDFDAVGYLRRFFDVDFMLPEPDRSHFLNGLLDGVQIEDAARSVLQAFFSLPIVSLRQVGQSVHRLGIAMASLPENEDRTMAAVVALVIRTLDADLYWQFVEGTVSDQDVVDRICERCGITDAVKQSNSKRQGCSTFEAVIAVAGEEIVSGDREPDYEQELESELVAKYRQVIAAESNATGGNAPVHYANRVLNLVKYYRERDAFSGPYFLAFLEAVRHIELLTGRE